MCAAKFEYIVVPLKHCELHSKIHKVMPQETWIISDTTASNSNPVRLELYYGPTVRHCASGYWPINKFKEKRIQGTISRSPLSTCQFLSTCKGQTDSKQSIASHSIVSTVIFDKVIIGKSARKRGRLSLWHHWIAWFYFQWSHLIYKVEMVFCLFLFLCLFVCTLYKSTFLNRSEPNFAHISPLVWKRRFSTFFTFSIGSECRILGTTWLPAQDTSVTTLYPWFLRVLVWRHVIEDDTCPESSATALYPWFLLVLVWCHRNDVAGDTCAFLLELSCTMGNAYKTP